MPKVGILSFCSGIRWTAVLEGMQRNPLTIAITLMGHIFRKEQTIFQQHQRQGNPKGRHRKMYVMKHQKNKQEVEQITELY